VHFTGTGNIQGSPYFAAVGSNDIGKGKGKEYEGGFDYPVMPDDENKPTIDNYNVRR